MAVPFWFRRILDHYEVPFEEIPHPPVYTAPHLAQTLHVSGHRVAKTVFLVAGDRPLAVVVQANTQVDLPRVAAVLGKGPLRFASEAEIAGWFRGCEPGAVPPLRLRGDECVLMDRSLAHLGKIVLPAGRLDVAVAVRFRDWYRMVRPGTGRFAVTGNGQAAAVRQPTVLVVEDEADTNQLLCRLLEERGILCRGVTAGQQALEAATAERPSAILLDLMLPDMTGFEMYERLRRAGPLKRTPVIVVSALSEDHYLECGRRMGADAYLTKPFLPKALVEEMQGILEDSRG
jgi:CheY-like chemotaxis protein/prolyl-tRNA editing enzyme YbaK/EbsC (Cys-tRNA(Pro) deacylase)